MRGTITCELHLGSTRFMYAVEARDAMIIIAMPVSEPVLEPILEPILEPVPLAPAPHI